MILYIIFSMFLEFIGSILRSFVGPLILVKSDYNSPIAKFTDKYRLLLYSISDFLVGVALLYLFYTQGMLTVRKEEKTKRAIVSFDKYKDFDALTNERSTGDSEEAPVIDSSALIKKRNDWESKILSSR